MKLSRMVLKEFMGHFGQEIHVVEKEYICQRPFSDTL